MGQRDPSALAQSNAGKAATNRPTHDTILTTPPRTEKFVCGPARTECKKKRPQRSRRPRNYSINRKWTMQEEVKLLALFIAIGPNWDAMETHFVNRQPSVIKCKMNNMVRYALLGAHDRVDEVGSFVNKMAIEIKQRNCTLANYHTFHLSNVSVSSFGPLIRCELEHVLRVIGPQPGTRGPDSQLDNNQKLPKSTPNPTPPVKPFSLPPQPTPSISLLPPMLPQPPQFQLQSLLPVARPNPQSNLAGVVFTGISNVGKVASVSVPRVEPCLHKSLCPEPSHTPPQSIASTPSWPSILFTETPTIPVGYVTSWPNSIASTFISIEPPYQGEQCGYSLSIPVNQVSSRDATARKEGLRG